MMENKIYNVIWIDDKYNEIDLPGNAEQDNIIIKPFKYGKDGIDELKAHINNWDGIIVDVKCLWASDNEVDRVENFHKIKEELLTLKSKRPIPIFVYSGQPDILSDESFKKSLNGRKLYRKNLDEEDLLSDIKLEADKLIEVQIRHKYLDILGDLPSDITTELIGALSFVENNVVDDPDVFNKLRKVIEWVMEQLNEYGLLAVQFNGANVSACSLYLGKKELAEYVPIHIQRSLHSCVEICNNGSHRNQIHDTVQNGQVPFLIRSTVFELLNILNWYCSLPHDDEYVEKMKAYIATVKPDNVIEGRLEKDEKENYHCGNCLITYTSKNNMGLKEGDLIRVTKYGSNTKGHPDTLEKYPLLAHTIEIL